MATSKEGGYGEQELRAAHDLCTGNETALRASELAGCFFCCEVYPASEIHEFGVRAKDDERTAMCAMCGTDTVIASSAAELSVEFLSAMKEYWFSESR